MHRTLMLMALLGTACAPALRDDAAASSGRGSGSTSRTSAKRVFVTATSYTGNLVGQMGAIDGLAAADQVCEVAASAANLSGNFVAWISSNNVNAIDRIQDVGPWESLSGTVLFNNKSHLMTQPLRSIDRDENDGSVWESVWTGTGVGGRASGSDCANWASESGRGTRGSSSDESEWTQSGTSSCSSKRHIYCFEQ